MARKLSLVFLPSIHQIYKWIVLEVLGILSRASFEFLRSLREEHLITLEGIYKEDHILELPYVDERVCYINYGRGTYWMWMYDVLISKFGVHIPFTHFQFTILEGTGATSSQLYTNSWAMVRGFEIIFQCLEVPPTPKAFFYLFTFTRPSGGGLTISWLSFPSSCESKNIFTV